MGPAEIDREYTEGMAAEGMAAERQLLCDAAANAATTGKRWLAADYRERAAVIARLLSLRSAEKRGAGWTE
ncbi:MAG: hypothetical protein HC927_06625 [Deltaproteobacteria bacterium]|nr:hypothetical protein [Deltaproteobacteria bacterium]